MASYTLVLGRDLREEGSCLGPVTVERLAYARMHANEVKTTLVVVSIPCPYYPEQKETMGQMMNHCLRRKGYSTKLLASEEFSTAGELRAFLDFVLAQPVGPIYVVSAPGHERRVRLIVCRLYGKNVAKRIRFVPVTTEQWSWTERFILEPQKCLNVFLPRSWQTRLTQGWRKFFGNSSW